MLLPILLVVAAVLVLGGIVLGVVSWMRSRSARADWLGELDDIRRDALVDGHEHHVEPRAEDAEELGPDAGSSAGDGNDADAAEAADSGTAPGAGDRGEEEEQAGPDAEDQDGTGDESEHEHEHEHEAEDAPSDEPDGPDQGGAAEGEVADGAEPPADDTEPEGDDWAKLMPLREPEPEAEPEPESDAEPAAETGPEVGAEPVAAQAAIALPAAPLAPAQPPVAPSAPAQPPAAPREVADDLAPDRVVSAGGRVFNEYRHRDGGLTRVERGGATVSQRRTSFGNPTFTVDLRRGSVWHRPAADTSGYAQPVTLTVHTPAGWVSGHGAQVLVTSEDDGWCYTMCFSGACTVELAAARSTRRLVAGDVGRASASYPDVQVASGSQALFDEDDLIRLHRGLDADAPSA